MKQLALKTLTLVGKTLKITIDVYMVVVGTALRVGFPFLCVALVGMVIVSFL